MLRALSARLVLALLLAAPLVADTEVVWEETPTHRIKIKRVDGKEVGRWKFPKKKAKAAKKPDDSRFQELMAGFGRREEAAAVRKDRGRWRRERSVARPAPILDPAKLKGRAQALKDKASALLSKEVALPSSDEAGAHRLADQRIPLEDERLALLAVSLDAFLLKHGPSGKARDLLRMAAEAFDPGSRNAPLAKALRPYAHTVAKHLEAMLASFPPGGDPRVDQPRAEMLVWLSAIRRATRQPAEAEAAARKAVALVKTMQGQGIEGARAVAHEALALALLSREEVTFDADAKKYDDIYQTTVEPNQASCRAAVAELDAAIAQYAQALKAFQAMAKARNLPSAAVQSVETNMRLEIKGLQGTRRKAGKCAAGARPYRIFTTIQLRHPDDAPGR